MKPRDLKSSVILNSKQLSRECKGEQRVTKLRKDLSSEYKGEGKKTALEKFALNISNTQGIGPILSQSLKETDLGQEEAPTQEDVPADSLEN